MRRQARGRSDRPVQIPRGEEPVERPGYVVDRLRRNPQPRRDLGLCTTEPEEGRGSLRVGWAALLRRKDAAEVALRLLVGVSREGLVSGKDGIVREPAGTRGGSGLAEVVRELGS